MIGKVHYSTVFDALSEYVGQQGKQAEVLAANGVRTSSAEEMAADFEWQRSMRPGLHRAVEHVALAWPPSETEQLTNEVMTQAALRYMELRGIDPAQTQWVLVRHNDEDHPHAHLLLNRVTNEGEVVPDKHSRLNSAQACRVVEEEMGFVNAARLGTANKLAAAEQAAEPSPELVQRLRLRAHVEAALAKHLPGATTVDQLRERLRDEQVTLLPTFNGEGKLQQVVFTADAFAGLHMRGSEVARTYSGGQLQQTLETAALRERILADRVRAQTLRHQALQAEQQGDYGQAAQLRYGDLPPVEQRLLMAEAQAATTLRGRVMLAKLGTETEASPALADNPVEPSVVTSATEKQPAVSSAQQPVAISPGPDAGTTAPPPPVISVVETAPAEPVIDWQTRYEQYTRERQTVLAHNWAVEKVDRILHLSPNATGVREAVAYVQQPATPLLANSGLLQGLQRELSRQQEQENEASYVVAERARLEKAATRFFGFGKEAIEARDKLHYLEMPPALPMQVGPLRYREPVPPEVGREQFIRQQEAKLTQLRQAVAGVLDYGITSRDNFCLSADRSQVKVITSSANGWSFQLANDSQIYRASEVMSDFAKHFNQSLTRGHARQEGQNQVQLNRGKA